MFYDDDATIFMGDFSTPVDLNGQDGYRGIFDRAYLLQMGLAESAKPQLLCIEKEVEVFKRGDKLTINSVDYLVVTKEPDGTGFTLIDLERA